MTMCRLQKWQLSLSYFLRYILLIVPCATLCPLHSLNAPWYIIILCNFDKQVMPMCRVQEWQLPLSDLSSLHDLICYALYFEYRWEYVHETIPFCRSDRDTVSCIKMWRLLCSNSPANPPPPKTTTSTTKKWIWILCQNSLTVELKIKFLNL